MPPRVPFALPVTHNSTTRPGIDESKTQRDIIGHSSAFLADRSRPSAEVVQNRRRGDLAAGNGRHLLDTAAPDLKHNRNDRETQP